MGILSRRCADMVTFVAVPATLAGSKETVHTGLIHDHLAATDPVGDGVGRQTCNRTTTADDIRADVAGNLNGITYFHTLANGNLDVPYQLVAIQSITLRCRNESGVGRNIFRNVQIFVGSAGVCRAIGRVVCSVVRIVAVVGNSDCVCNVLALHSGAHMGNIYCAVDIHSRILHTDICRVLNGKTGSL